MQLALFSVSLLSFFAGCAIEKPKLPDLVWPEPPEKPRIKFVGVLRSQTDFGKESSEAVAEVLLGKRKAHDLLQQPMAVAPSRDGKRVYVTDYAKGSVVVFDLERQRMSRFGDEGHAFRSPFGIAVDERDNVYVADSAARLVRVFDAAGRFLRNIGDPSVERPTGIAIDPPRRRIYVADSSSRTSDRHVVHVFDPDGTHLSALGHTGRDKAGLYFPTYVAVDGAGNVYVTDTLNSRVQVFSQDGLHVRAIGQPGDGPGRFDKPKGVAIDTFGNIYVVDSNFSNVQIFNQRGDALLFFSARGRKPGLLFNPTGISIDARNRIYVADAFNARVGIYQLVNTTAGDSFVTPSPRAEKGGGTTTGTLEHVRNADERRPSR